MRPQGSPQELERRRRQAIALLDGGASITEVARRLGCSHSSVILWRDRVKRRGPDALQARPASGRPPKLSAKQLKKLPRLLLQGATASGFTTELWTTRRIATVIPSVTVDPTPACRWWTLGYRLWAVDLPGCFAALGRAKLFHSSTAPAASRPDRKKNSTVAFLPEVPRPGDRSRARGDQPDFVDAVGIVAETSGVGADSGSAGTL